MSSIPPKPSLPPEFDEDAPTSLDPDDQRRVSLAVAGVDPELHARWIATERARRAGIDYIRAAKEQSAMHQLAGEVPVLMSQVREVLARLEASTEKRIRESGSAAWAQTVRTLGQSVIDAPKTFVASLGEAGGKLGWMPSSLIGAALLVWAAGGVLGDRRLELSPTTGFAFYTPEPLGVEAIQNVAREPERAEQAPLPRPRRMPVRNEEQVVPEDGTPTMRTVPVP